MVKKLGRTKRLRKIMSIALATSMCLQLTGFTAYADTQKDSNEGTPEITISIEAANALDIATDANADEPAGTVEDPKTTIKNEIKNTTDAEGNAVESEITEKGWEGETITSPSGTTSEIIENVEGNEKKEETTVTDDQGNVLEEKKTVDGEQTTTIVSGDMTTESSDSEDGILNVEGKEDIPVDVTVTPGEKNSITQEIEIGADDVDGFFADRPAESETTENGVTTQIEVDDVIGADGQTVIGYKVTEIVKINPSVSHLEIEARPAAGQTTDADGTIKDVQVEDVVENGIVIGYKAVTILKDAEGNLISTETKTVTGTKTESGEEIKTITTKELAHDEGEMPTAERIVEVEMGEVVDNGGIIIKTEIAPSYPKPDYSNVETLVDEHIVANGLDKNALTENEIENIRKQIRDQILKEFKAENDYDSLDLYGNLCTSHTGIKPTIEGEYMYESLGDKVGSAVSVHGQDFEGGSGGFRSRQWVLTDKDGGKHYTYCTDLYTGMNGYHHTYMRMDLEESGYLNDEAAAYIRSIVSKGYWGTDEGQGSLDSVKELLREYAVKIGWTDEEIADIDKLTAGEALTGTQAAIWKYGNSARDIQWLNQEDVAYHKSSVTYKNGVELSDKLVNALYDCLVEQEVIATGNTTPLDDDVITSATVSVKEEIEKDIFNTDVSFVLSVKPNTLTGDLWVKVLDANTGATLATRRLTEESTADGELADIVEDTVTIKNITLNNGQKVTLNIEGIQKMDDYAYVYVAKGGYTAAQSLVSLGTATKEVDLSVDLTINVGDPSYTITTKTETGSIGTETVEEEWYVENVVVYEQEKSEVVTPTPTDPTPTEPTPTEPIPTEPTPTDPTPVEPEYDPEPEEDEPAEVAPAMEPIPVDVIEIEENDTPLGAFEIEDNEIPMGVLPAMDGAIPFDLAPATGTQSTALPFAVTGFASLLVAAYVLLFGKKKVR